MLEFDLRVRRGAFELAVAQRIDAPIVGLYGRSGSGKTTLLHAIAGLLRPDAGRIVLGDLVLFDSSTKRDVPAHRRRMGVVFQDGRLFPHLSVRANLRYGQRQLSSAEARRRFHDVVELLQLSPLLARRPADLSGGERQRVALGRTLLSEPALLLLDEPLASLDVEMKRAILPFLRRIRDAFATPIVYVSHDAGEMLQLTDQVLVLDGGRGVGFGRYRDLALDQRATMSALVAGLVNVLPMRVVRHDTAAGCSRLTHADSPADAALELDAPLCDVRAGDATFVSILPEDIALAIDRVERISIRNQFPGIVRRHVNLGGMVIVELEASGTSLLAEVTAGSFARLGLARGRPVTCLIKANAIRPAADRRL